MFWILIILIASILLILYLQKLNYWKERNIEVYSFLKILYSYRTRQLGMVISDIYREMYNDQKPCIAVESLLQSVLIIQDLEMIRDIAITNFESFPDRGLYVNHRDPLSTNVVRLDYELWKPLRQKLTPTFSAAKMRYMFPTLLKVGQQFVEVLREKCERQEHTMEMRDLCARFTTDVIGNIAFGVECNSLKYPNTEFRKQGDKGFDVCTNPITDLLGSRYPKLFNFLNVKVFPKEITEFFTRLVKETMDYREKHQIRRNDFMDIMLELRKDDGTNDKFSLTLESIIGQVYAFFLAGFETSSSSMSYALYELAKNPEIQNKTRSNIQEVLEKNDQRIDYDTLQEMTYLKQVMQETLRKYPIGPIVPRLCRKQCTLKTATHSVCINPGTAIIIPIYGIHHNPDYYPDPESFQPDRFAPDEVAKRNVLTYLPFGIGPKLCIGERFARMQVSLGLALLISQFRFSVVDDTPEFLEFDPNNYFTISVKGSLYLKVEML